MAQASKNYKLIFTSGEFAGRSFALDVPSMVLGSGPESTLRFEDDKLQSRHITLQVQTDGVNLQVQGDAQVKVNQLPLSADSEVLLPLGTQVELGDQIFVIEECDDSECPSASALTQDLTQGDRSSDSGEQETETETEIAPTATANDAEINGAKSPADSSAPEDPEVAHNTRYASTAELQDLRQYSKTQAQRRVLVYGLLVLLIGLVIGFPYFYSLWQFEKTVTWPGELNNQYDDGEFRTQIDSEGQFLIYYPKSAQMIEKKSAPNCEVLTALGKNLDVPFHLVLNVTELPQGYRTTRAVSFAQWVRTAAEKYNLALIESQGQFFLNRVGAGYPYYKAYYTRYWGKIRWRGMASYLRYKNYEIVLLREVPLQHFSRSENILNTLDCLVVSPTMSRTFWDIPDKIDAGSTTRLLQKVTRELNKNSEISVWEDVDYWLRSLLCRAHENQDTLLINSVLPLWAEFRNKQQLWYSRCCLAYQAFSLVNDQKGMKQIFDKCLARFPSPDDYRHIRIIKNIWVIE